MDFNPEKVAKAEIGWWKSHHEKNYDEVIKHMTTVYEKLYGLNRKAAQEIVLLRIEAAKEHDLAEKEGLSESESEMHWSNALQLMIKHFEMLKEAPVVNAETIEILRLKEGFHKDPSD